MLMFDALGAKTQDYLEVVSGKTGQRALSAWLQYTATTPTGRHYLTEEQRLQQARDNASRWKKPDADAR
jgi:hypothetical protein